ncbi:peptidoglycan DD-metalloendopeptidase family protein [Paenibacillus sp. NPDC057934]|uniref:peptidoglycan DD-metalloendopeptidase family protein n=1 Tax=Paenibacillus sp. NPDC057934 TaxID=3346282 RepID=UPI0036DEB6D4
MNDFISKKSLVLLSLIGSLSVGSLAASASADSAKSVTAPVSSITKVSAVNSKSQPQASSFKPDQLLQLLQQEKYEVIYGQTIAEYKKAFPLQEFKQLARLYHSNVTSYKLKSHVTLNNTNYYAWTDPKGERTIQVMFNSKNQIEFLIFDTLKLYPETDAKRTQTTFQLPFQGNWFVFWGGPNELINYHYGAEQQRYAYDLIVVNNGFSYKGDPTKNESYYAFGKPIFAAAAGKVVKVVNNIHDNSPVGTENTKEIAGNHVIIDHGNGEFSYYAHLQKGSVSVKVGDQVKPGDRLGKCGNSGNSSEAHLHFEVANSAELYTTKSLRVNWKDADDYEQGTYIKTP